MQNSKLLEKILLWAAQAKKEKKPEVSAQANTGFSNETNRKSTI